MAKYTAADCRLCRRENQKLFLKGDRCYSQKCALTRRAKIPGQQWAGRKKMTEYGSQLREKQKIKRYYGLLEKQFHNTYEIAERMKGNTGENLLFLLERRLDNVVYRMGIAQSRALCRQIVNHGHITVNGRVVDIPSYIVKVGDVVAIKEGRENNGLFNELSKIKVTTPKWMEFDTKSLSGKINAMPQRDDIDMNFAEHLVIEHYSK